MSNIARLAIAMSLSVAGPTDGDDSLSGTSAADTLEGGLGNDTLDGKAGGDRLVGGAGNDTYIVDNSGDMVVEVADQGTDAVRTSLASYALGANVEQLVYTGAAAFTGTGNALNNVLIGGEGSASKLDGGAGNDTLAGGSADDSLIGGLGDDSFIGSYGKDTIDGGAGNDTVDLHDWLLTDFIVSRPNTTDTVLTHKSYPFVLTLRNVESILFDDNLKTLAQVQAVAIGAGNDSITGSSGNDTLNGLAGADTLVGMTGDDTYVVDNVGDVVTEAADEGTDLVQVALSSGTYTLAANVENATVTGTTAVNLTGNILANQLTGNGAANILIGGAGNDTLDGGAGADKLTGGAGDDTYKVDNASDVVTEVDGEGTDTVLTTLATYTLGANVEKVTYSGTALFTGTGNALNNTITAANGGAKLDGGAGDDSLVGGSGNDSLVGGLGNDTLVAGSGKDTLDGGAGTGDVASGFGVFSNYTVSRPNGTDTVLTDNAGNVYTVRNVEQLVFDGVTMDLSAVQDNVATTGNDSLHGSSGADTLNGGAGADTLEGRGGSDTYVIDNTGDVIVELADEGTDLAQVGLAAAGTYTLAANVENGAVTSAATVAVNLTGNGLDNKLTGNGAVNILIGGEGNDTLDGGVGADKLTGGLGNDTYIVDVAGDVLTEGVGEGTDSVETVLASYTLGANFENLKATGSAAFTGTGNTLDNKLVGNGAGNKLDGGAGNDTLTGGAGADSLLGGLGTDSLVASAGKDTIDGGDGSDTLGGLEEFSHYTITRVNTTDTLLTLNGSTSILVRGVESFAFADETKTLESIRDNTASPGNDNMLGTADADTLNGGAGNDTLAGLAGNDTYIVDNALDVVTEAEDAGTDTVNVAFTAAGTYTLGANVENGTVTAAATIAANITGNALANKLTGNAAANTLTGGAGNDSLDGGAGADKLIGGTGDDTYTVDAATDVVTEAVGEGTDTVLTALATYTLAANVEVLSYTGSAAFTGTGNASNNTITGANAGNKLDGGAGNDSLTGGNGNDSLIGGLGNDTLVATGGKDTIDGGDGTADVLQGLSEFEDYVVTRPTATDTVLTGPDGQVITVRGVESFDFDGEVLTLAQVQDNIASVGNDSLQGDDDDNTLNGGLGADTMVGKDGDDTYVADNVGDVVTELADQGDDLVQVALTAAGTYTLGANVENGTVTAAATIAANITGNALDNKLVGNAAANTLTGGAGDDSLDGGAGADKLIGGTGDDTYTVDAATDVVTEGVGEGADTVRTALATYTLAANVETLVYTGSAAFTGTGNASDNILSGANAGNKLDGGAGNDSLIGGNGNDSLIGGLGNDTLVATGGKDTIDGGDGTADVLQGLSEFEDYVVTRPTATDTVLTGPDGQVITVRGVESFIFDGETLTLAEVQDNIASVGNDSLHGDDDDNTLNGGLGADTMTGKLGDDTYVVDNLGDVVTELADEGDDLVQVALTAAGTYTLGANVENGTVTAAATIAANITGNALDNKLVGNAAANTLTGGAGNDSLDGGAGADKLIGGLGDDTYTVDAATDVVTEGVGEGADTVRTALATYTLAANVETLVYTGSAAFTGTGNASDNIMSGANAGNKLDGAAGNDSLTGGNGNDSLIGGLGNDTLVASGGKDTIDGGDGTADVLQGLSAFEDYVVTRPAATDTVLTGPDGQVITVRGVESFDFDGEVLTLAQVQDNIASPFADTLHGDDDDNTINGGLGADTMAGKLGDDTYVAENVGDLAVEEEDEGTDLVQVALTAAGTYTLAANVENGTVTAAATIAANITGNALDNKLVGNAAANTLTGGAGDDSLDGGAGADKLIGGLGDDTYTVDVATDVVTEAAGEGRDTVETALVTYTLAANVEVLTYTGSAAFTGTGNAGDNIITGANAGNKLDGGAGNDALVGGSGNDSLVGGLGDDSFIGAGGKDTIDGGAGEDSLGGLEARDFYTVTRPTATDTVLTGEDGSIITVRGVEHFDFGGELLTLAEVVDNIVSAGNDVLHGKEGDVGDYINGLAGNDTMSGGQGNDSYVVDNPNDVIIELPDEGIDTVEVAFTAAGTYVLSENVEKADVTAAAGIAVNLTGNDLNNRLGGNAAANVLSGGGGDDTLDGGAGADKMIGGLGDDGYTVDNAGDVVTELAGEGHDEVLTYLATYVLPANVEDLYYGGSAAFTGTGNALDNLIAGGGNADKLDGGAGNDTLAGRAGNDSLLGGLGDDALYAGSGKDTLDGGAGENTAFVDGAFDDYTVTRPNATDTVLTDGDGNVITLRNITIVDFDGDMRPIEEVQLGIRSDGNDHLIGDDDDNTMDGGLGADTLEGMGGDDTYVIDNVGDVVIDMDGTDLMQITKTGAYTLAEFVENGTITAAATAPVSLAGNELDNVLTGNALANTLSGDFGDDTLIGGAGTDTLKGGEGDDVYNVDVSADVVTELEEEGIDTVETTAASYTLGANVENLTYLGTGAFTGTGNALDNVITGTNGGVKLDGGAGFDILTGGSGNDSLQGGADDDQLSAGTGKDTVDGGAGEDMVQLSKEFFDYSVVRTATDWIFTDLQVPGNVTTVRNVEQFMFGESMYMLEQLQESVGGSGADDLFGTPEDDKLDGGLGNDTMTGDMGDDTYVLSGTGDVVNEDPDGGDDTVLLNFTAAATYVLPGEVENGTVIAAATVAVNITGNELDNMLVGNAAANTLRGLLGNDSLDGGAGNDTLIGGDGDDHYLVSETGDVVTELAEEGDDTVHVKTATYTLGANLENLVYEGAVAFTGTGNALDNFMSVELESKASVKLDGGAGNDALEGGVGNDSLIGGLGDDNFSVALGGADTVDGGAGDDTLMLGARADYSVSRLNDTDLMLIHLDMMEGLVVDTIVARGIETFQFDDGVQTLDELKAGTPGAGVDTVTGTSINDTLDGGAGADSLIGGEGDDTYLVDNTGDTVVEFADQGNDQVILLLASGTYTVAANVEYVAASGHGAVNITGNAGDEWLAGNDAPNKLTGGAGDDTLEGMGGADTLTGGLGDDRYYIDSALASVVEAVGEGTDTVELHGTLASFTLAANVENLLVLGQEDVVFTGTGNALNNEMTVEFGSAKLDGGAGNDTLTSAEGDDQLLGGLGDDVFHLGGGNDTVDGGAGTDALFLQGTGVNYSAHLIGEAAVRLIRFSDGSSIVVGNVEQFVMDDATYTLEQLLVATGEVSPPI